MELSTERQVGMGVGSIPVSMVWNYLDRFNLPDWWEPILLQADASIVSSANKDTSHATANTVDANKEYAEVSRANTGR